jgi:hypothetical protein
VSVPGMGRLGRAMLGWAIRLTIKFLHMEFLREFWHFLKERKKWWLVPLMILIILLTVFIILGSATALAPFIYSLF